MAETSSFHLKFDDFKNTISTKWQELRKETSFTDVTLACDNQKIKAHKVVLSSSSSVFKYLLEQNPHQHPLLYLRGVKYSNLEKILDFIYEGEVNVENEELNGFLALANDLKIECLSEEIQDKDNFDDNLINVVEELVPTIKRKGCWSHFTEDNYSKNKTTDSAKFRKTTDSNLNCDEVSLSGISNLMEEVTNDMPINSSSLSLTENRFCNNLSSNKNSSDFSIKEENHETNVTSIQTDKKVHHKCNQCDYQTNQVGTLNRHREIHEGIRYPCEQCKKMFSAKRSLKKHLSLIH